MRIDYISILVLLVFIMGVTAQEAWASSPRPDTTEHTIKVDVSPACGAKYINLISYRVDIIYYTPSGQSYEEVSNNRTIPKSGTGTVVKRVHPGESHASNKKHEISLYVANTGANARIPYPPMIYLGHPTAITVDGGCNVTVR